MPGRSNLCENDPLFLNSLSHDSEPLPVVVCVPCVKSHVTVPPTSTETDMGEKAKLLTVTDAAFGMGVDVGGGVGVGAAVGSKAIVTVGTGVGVGVGVGAGAGVGIDAVVGNVVAVGVNVGTGVFVGVGVSVGEGVIVRSRPYVGFTSTLVIRVGVDCEVSDPFDLPSTVSFRLGVGSARPPPQPGTASKAIPITKARNIDRFIIPPWNSQVSKVYGACYE